MKSFSRSLLVPTLLMAALSPARAQDSHPAPGTSSAPAAGHRPALLRVGMGVSLSSSSDFPVLRTHLEYAPQFGQHVRLGSRLAYLGGTEVKRYAFSSSSGSSEFAVPHSYRAVNAEQEIYWLPFGANKRVEFGVGGGGFLSYYRATSVAAITYGLDANYRVETFSYVPRRQQNVHAGFITSLYVDMALDPAAKWRLGGRLSLQSGVSEALNLNNSAPGGQLQLSRAL